MSDVWKQWEGQVADHKYQLQRYLGSTDHSVVFLAEFRPPEQRKAALKFVPADSPGAEQQLAAWTAAAQLSHPGLLRIYGTGVCKIEDIEVLYVAMEYAGENLAEILPQRALTDDEAREILNATVDMLVYLHGKNLAHGHIKPSNILAIEDRLKVSSDTILPAGELREMRRERSAYDAPEITTSPYTAAADVWSLGVTIVEALTQQLAVLPFNENAEPVVPPTLHQPFLEIAQHSLRRDPKRRWTSAQIAERLNPAAVIPKASAAAAGASAAPAVPAAPTVTAPPPALAPVAKQLVAPLSVPLSKERAIPLAKQPQRPSAPSPVARPAENLAARQTVALPNYVVPLLAGVLVLVAIIALPKILHRRAQSEASSTASSTAPEAASAPVESSVKPADSTAKQQVTAKSAVSEPAKSTSQEHPVQAPKQPVAEATAASAVLRSSDATPTPRTSSASPGRGEPLDQVLPEVPAKALATIQGTVRVGVKVHVDAAGNVSDAALEAPGPSRYFADLSVKAARSWVFNPPEADGRSVPTDWLIEFYFTQAGAKAVAQQVAP
jgi:TonB family protein